MGCTKRDDADTYTKHTSVSTLIIPPSNSFVNGMIHDYGPSGCKMKQEDTEQNTSRPFAPDLSQHYDASNMVIVVEGKTCKPI